MRKITSLFMILVLLMLSPAVVLAQEPLKTIQAKVGNYQCDLSEWHFVITALDTPTHAPPTIQVTWANGATQDVPLEKVTDGVAHYTTTANLNSSVTQATAQIYLAWSGQFNLSHGPCRPTAVTLTSFTATADPDDQSSWLIIGGVLVAVCLIGVIVFRSRKK